VLVRRPAPPGIRPFLEINGHAYRGPGQEEVLIHRFYAPEEESSASALSFLVTDIQGKFPASTLRQFNRQSNYASIVQYCTNTEQLYCTHHDYLHQWELFSKWSLLCPLHWPSCFESSSLASSQI
jgi:hypothetical protein